MYAVYVCLTWGTGMEQAPSRHELSHTAPQTASVTGLAGSPLLASRGQTHRRQGLSVTPGLGATLGEMQTEAGRQAGRDGSSSCKMPRGLLSSSLTLLANLAR